MSFRKLGIHLQIYKVSLFRVLQDEDFENVM